MSEDVLFEQLRENHLLIIRRKTELEKELANVQDQLKSNTILFQKACPHTNKYHTLNKELEQRGSGYFNDYEVTYKEERCSDCDKLIKLWKLVG